MNNIFVSNVSPSLTSIQTLSIKQLIEDAVKSGVIFTREDVSNSLKSKLDIIKQNGKLFNYVPFNPGDKLSSEVLNQYFENINIDLKSLYSTLASIISNERNITAVTKDDFIKTKSAIVELINQLRLYAFLKNNPEYQDAKYIDFNNAVNNTPVRPKALVDVKTKTLKLPPASINRYSNARFNLDAAKVSFEHLGGGISNKFDKSFAIENTLDSNPNNFWASIVFCDAKPLHKVRLSHNSEERFLGSGKQYGQMYESNGVVFNVDYTFSRTIEVNNIKLLPIADFPVYLLDISYKTTDSSDRWITFKEFDPTAYPEGLDWIEWNGPLTACTAIRIVLEQANADTLTYHIPKNISRNNELWEELLSLKYNELIHNIELDQVLIDKISLDSNQLAYLNKLDGLENKTINSKFHDPSNKDFAATTGLINVTKDELLSLLPELATSKVDGQPIFRDDNLVEINKLQYVMGLRFVEFNNITFEPFGYYESPKFESNANILEVSIDTDEDNHESIDSITADRFQDTSIEYEIEISDRISFPIAPISTIIEGANGDKACKIRDELLVVNRSNYKATTRFYLPSWLTDSNVSVQIRKNGQRISPLVLNSGFGGQLNTYNYTVSIFTDNDSNRYIQVLFNSQTFDPRSNYTINYLASENAAIVNLNDLLNSSKNLPAESFATTDKNNSLQLQYYPFIEYGIINNTGLWSLDSDKWRFAPSTLNYSVGKASINTGTLTNVTGLNTFWSSNGPKELLTGSIFGFTGASIKFVGDNRSYAITSIATNSGLTVSEQINTGFLNGNLPTGLPYVIGKTQYIDGQYYGLDNVIYEPLKVYINDVKATNKTDYESREHAAFNTQNVDTRIYEYIQAGRNIYFNAPASGKIQVDYSWLTKYIKVNALLRSHKAYNSKVTPILRSYTLRIKNNKL